MLIYSTYQTERLRYIVAVLWNGAATITSDKTAFQQYADAKINYSTESIVGEALQIVPSGLLFETEIKKQTIEIGQWNNHPIFFSTPGDIPFDVLSAAFYLISRYEEYLPHQKDSYGRFDHTESVAYRHHFLHLPVVDIWMQQLHDLLRIRFANYQPETTTFSYLPTYDIDIAFAFKGKSWWRQLGGLLADCKNRNRQQIKTRWLVWNGKQQDPFDVYDWLDTMHQQFNLKPVYFFLLAKRMGKYDKNLHPASKPLRQLIQRIHTANKIGIHPSWQSHDDVQLLQQECQQLSNITNISVDHSRQHYIQFTLPYTFRCLLQANIKYDYSMGYGSINGFRASTSKPFYWYDLMNEQQTDLLLHTFCYMEANSFFEQGFSAEQAAEELNDYYNIVQSVNGQLITIFHNHFITTEPQWIAWRKLYENFLTEHCS